MYKPKLRLGSECPQCGCVMGIEESDWNKCGSCGYPESEDEEDDWDIDDRLDELEMTKEEQESFMKPLKTKMQPNLDFPNE